MLGEPVEPAEELEETTPDERILAEADDVVRADEQFAPEQRFHIGDVPVVDAEDPANPFFIVKGDSFLHTHPMHHKERVQTSAVRDHRSSISRSGIVFHAR